MKNLFYTKKEHCRGDGCEEYVSNWVYKVDGWVAGSLWGWGFQVGDSGIINQEEETGRGGSDVPRQPYVVWADWSGLKFRVTHLPVPSNIAENITHHLWSALSPGLHKTLANLFFFSAELCTSLPSSFTLCKWPCFVHCRAKRKHQNTAPTLSLVSIVWQKEPNLS